MRGAAIDFHAKNGVGPISRTGNATKDVYRKPSRQPVPVRQVALQMTWQVIRDTARPGSSSHRTAPWKYLQNAENR
jgi:hypothetical protein